MTPSHWRSKQTVCLAASPGGHIAELQAAQAAFDGLRRVWVTGPSRQAEVLRAAGEDVQLLAAWGRDTPGLEGLVPNFRGAATLARSYRPRAVVTNGAGLVAPFALIARLTGSELIVIETMARVTKASLTGRVLGPFARSVIVQWPEMRDAYRRAIVCRPALLESAPARAGEGQGTFVSVGTRQEPFDRLLAMVDQAVAEGLLPRPVIAQSGTSRYRPASYSASPSMTPTEMAEALRSARYVVCHGGSGLIAEAIVAGRRPLVLARRKAAGEHRTEHQQQLVSKLDAEGAVVALDRKITRRDVRMAAGQPDRRTSPSVRSLEAVLGDELSAVLA
jgi:UDP-N-acetylglucosamine--N-acetylmuramyl-(pentapeptide) pyrophosphoryl-undecaprenol N-acetylglucosamine transferase